MQVPAFMRTLALSVWLTVNWHIEKRYSPSKRLKTFKARLTFLVEHVVWAVGVTGAQFLVDLCLTEKVLGISR